ncbi:hypothetical protein GCM10027059_33780 [Myceligenerans halotolerans]
MRADSASTTGDGSPSRTARATADTPSYASSGLVATHGAEQRPIPASAHGLPGCRGTRAIRAVHWRSGSASCRAATASFAARDPPNGPMWAMPEVVSRTTDRRGYGSSVSRTHTARSGCLERRLYRGSCSAISRSSRTWASSGVAHTTGVTRSAIRTISVTRRRFSAAVKYERTRLWMFVLVPTYSTSSPGPRNR